MLGYFSLVGLLRLHSLLGDYYQAIKVLENIELNKKVWLLHNDPITSLHLSVWCPCPVLVAFFVNANKALLEGRDVCSVCSFSVVHLRLAHCGHMFVSVFLCRQQLIFLSPYWIQSMYSRVPECQITTYYYVGFAYLMMRRYQDAIRVFANILLYIQRTRNMFQRSTYKYEMVSYPWLLSQGGTRILLFIPLIGNVLTFSTFRVEGVEGRHFDDHPLESSFLLEDPV